MDGCHSAAVLGKQAHGYQPHDRPDHEKRKRTGNPSNPKSS